jgi:hypothetical protein
VTLHDRHTHAVSEASAQNAGQSSEQTSANGSSKDRRLEVQREGEIESEPKEMPFWMLGLDLPPAPLFHDTVEKNIIPQVPLLEILRKFDGTRVYEQVRAGRNKFKVSHLPPYLVLHFKRFVKNNFFVEKNPTIVTFPVRNLELREAIPVPKRTDGSEMPSRYDLIANLCHDGKPGAGSYRAHVYDKGDQSWFETQDLNVREVLPQQVSLSEALMMVYERQEQPAQEPHAHASKHDERQHGDRGRSILDNERRGQKRSESDSNQNDSYR